MGLGTAVADPESGHHFVEDQQGTVLLGEFPQTFEEAGFRLNEASVTNDRLEDHTGDGVRVLGKQSLNGLEIVVRRRQGIGGGAAGHARGIGQAKGCHSGTSLHQEHVRMAVVAALELDHLVAAGVGTDQAQTQPCRLRCRC